MTNRNESSTRFDRVFINSDLADDAIEVWLNADKAKEPKVAPNISHTVYPSGQTKLNQTCVTTQLTEIH